MDTAGSPSSPRPLRPLRPLLACRSLGRGTSRPGSPPDGPAFKGKKQLQSMSMSKSHFSIADLVYLADLPASPAAPPVEEPPQHLLQRRLPLPSGQPHHEVAERSHREPAEEVCQVRLKGLTTGEKQPHLLHSGHSNFQCRESWKSSDTLLASLFPDPDTAFSDERRNSAQSTGRFLMPRAARWAGDSPRSGGEDFFEWYCKKTDGKLLLNPSKNEKMTNL